MFDQVTHWESTDVSTWLSDAQILAHFTVESPWETISPPLKKSPPPFEKIHWILYICLISGPSGALISGYDRFNSDIHLSYVIEE